MKKLLFCILPLASFLAAQTSLNSIPHDSSSVASIQDTSVVNSHTETETTSETPNSNSRIDLYEQSKSAKSEKKVKAPGNKPIIQPFFTGGLQVFSSTLGTGTMALNIEAGVILNKKHLHSLEGYWGLFDWNTNRYEIDRVWGTNYNYLWMNNFGTKFVRLDLGFKAGYNYYSEKDILTGKMYETATFGGPRGQLNFNLGKLGIGGGYTMLLGYREYDNDRSGTRVDLWNITFGVNI